jgi:cytochrome c oxidase subunit III
VTDYVAGDRPVGAVPRTMEAPDAEALARAIRRRPGFPVGWWGMAILIASEATLFGCLFGTYFYLRFRTAVWPPAGAPEPKVVVPLIMAGVLATTSLPMALASQAARHARLRAARLLILLALIVQAGYFAMEMHLFVGDTHDLDPTRSAYGSIYFTMLGADHAHVFVGMLLDLWLLAKLARGLTAYRINATQAIALYWHAVNLITLFVVGALLSATV